MSSEALVAAIEAAATSKDDRTTIACAAALTIAEEHGVSAQVVGDICNEKNIRIAHCQLGCFK